MLVPRTPLVEEDGKAWSELHLLDAHGGVRPFVSGEVNVRKLEWLPDGSMVTFLEKRGADKEVALYGIPISGGEARKLAGMALDISDYAISADGKQVALIAAEPEPEAAAESRKKGFNQKVFEEVWRHNGLWVDSLVEEVEPRRILLDGTVHLARWSPDGKLLAVVTAPTPSADDALVFKRVSVIDVETGEVRVRISNPGKLGPLAWSPDGDYLALVSAADEHDPRAGRLLVIAASGGEWVDVLPELSGHVDGLAWVDAETIAYLSQESVYSRFGTVQRDGSDPRTILAGPGPVWSSFDVAENGDVVFIASAAQHPNEVFVLEKGLDQPKRLTQSNPWLHELQFGVQEVVRYQARDGLEIEGLLIRPLNEVAGRPYPLILQVHGGPEAHYSDGWLTHFTAPGQVAAAGICRRTSWTIPR